jgi:glycosyltransferase involved in cell wall biosynthesis
MRKSLSVAMITMNESANLSRTLASLRQIPEIVPEVVVVDSGSTDATVEIARNFGALVFAEPWRGYAAQKNSAIAHTSGDWVLSLDADEELSVELAREIAALLDSEPVFSAYRIPRLNHFLGRPLRHGGYWPDPKLRLFRNGWALFEERPVHETLKAAGTVGWLQGHLVHRCYPTLEEYIAHMNRYSSEGAQLLANKDRDSKSLPALMSNAILNPAATFLYNYVFRLGFLDGREGLIQHLNHSVYIHWKFVKAWQAGRTRE